MKHDGFFAKLSAAFKRETPAQQAQVSAAIRQTRLQVVDIVASYAKDDGSISRSRLPSLLRELESVEKEIRAVGNRSIFGVMRDSAAQAFSGVRPLFGGNSQTTAAGRSVADYLVKRTGPDGLRLSDRVWDIAADHRDAIGKVLRRGILRGDSIARMTRDVTEVYRVEDWKARRLVVTETNTAFRTAIGQEAERLDFVKGLRLHPGAKHSRKCVDLAGQNRHGLGTGIFLPSDTDIYNPHPQCTSYLTFVLKDEEVR